MTAGAGPLHGVRVLEYAQYVAGPFAGMLLADLGADVVKVEPPGGDAWRHYEPFAPGESRYFYALNRNKRSVVLNLKTDEGRAGSRALIAGADAIVHNFPPPRARRFGVDREAVRESNPAAVWCCVSALGSDGPQAEHTGFDLIAQSLSGLLLADARPGDVTPRRAGGLAMADFTAGLLAAIAVLAGLVERGGGKRAPGIEVSLLGAALAVQAQRFVAVAGIDEASPGAGSHAASADLAAQAAKVRAAEELEPYYRTYLAADGFLALSCLQEAQRRAALGVLGLEDPYARDPQAPPADERERVARRGLVARFEARLKTRPVVEWVAAFRDAGVPAAEVRRLGQLFSDPQALANGLVQRVEQPGVGPVDLLGSLFKVDGRAGGAGRPAPPLGAHTDEVLAEAGAAPA